MKGRITSVAGNSFITSTKTSKPAVVAQVEGGLEAASSTLQVVKPLIPEPFATGSIAIIGGLAALWQLISKRKTITVLDRVKLGAQITADSVDTIIKPSIEVWEKFKARQKSESSNTNAIMPDQLKAA